MLENNTEMIKSLRNRTVRLEHEGDYWTAEENERLKSMFSDNLGISEIALTLQRTEPAVMQQIEKWIFTVGKPIRNDARRTRKAGVPVKNVTIPKPPVLMAETARKHTTRMIRRKYVRRIR